MGKPAGFKGVIKPVNWGENFVIVPRAFAQDMTISPFTKAVLLDVQSHSEDWETNVGSIMHNYDVGRDKARSVLTEGQRAGYVYMHQNRNLKVQIDTVTYHFSTCRRTLKEFVIGNGWETEESYALKIQALGQTAAALKPKPLGQRGKRQTKALKNQAPAFAELAPENLGPENLGTSFERQRNKRENERKEEKEAASATPSGIFFRDFEKEKGDEDTSSSFDAFLSDYKKGVAAAAGRDVPAGGEASARARFCKLTASERAQLRESMARYFGELKKDKWRTPQQVSKFVFDGWQDFLPKAADKAKAAAKVEHDQIRCVAMDINNSQHSMAKRWWERAEDVPPEIHERAVAYAMQHFDYKPQVA